ncbi:hypothetical protein J8F10_05005 [Gemmata sp. G18]|uniref:HEAT repeat domain-containing protein n=1 Tax=Gemmata palustris TaxID=2822762 RepID=A0ABS5BLS0_9BACT|nr:hypothetical protein [Gemmata palustris]MBP3954641.1 hypothetical protein [Gemmata palustris]
MTLARYTAWTLLVGAGFALWSAPARAQQPAIPVPDSSLSSVIVGYRDIPRGGITNEDLKAARENFAKFAKYYADVIAHPLVYAIPQDFKPPTPTTRHLAIDGQYGLLQDLSRFLKEPGPSDPKVGPDQAVYIRELGAALDAELKKLIEGSDSERRIVRVNAARVLAHVCKGGAPAHYATLTSLLGNANTPTEVKYHLFHAAGNLLAAHDPNWLNSRTHVRQIDEPNVVSALVKVLQDCINNPVLLFAGLPENKVEKATPDQLAVIGLVRRQAIKALAQVRFVALPGVNGAPLYPAHTLARVALSDPALVPAPGPADAGEAVIGLCNMAPVELKNGRAVPMKYNADAAVEAITAGLITFAEPRASDAFDRRLPWRSYGLRIAEAMRNWRPLFDPDFDPTQPNKFNASSVPPVVDDLFKDVVPNVLAPMDKVDSSGKPDIGSKVDIEGLRRRLSAIRENPKRSTTLLPDNKQTAIDFAPVKK